MAGSYAGAAENFGFMVSGFVKWGDVDTNDRRLLKMVPEIFKQYFDGNQAGLKEDIDKEFRGEIAAMAMMDAVIRLIPGALGDGQSA